jgi:alkanesulfonate monooxygenase SsuD/methylene tetrahydromethanopterin reductase-like flavin-dependent oxidoreductase (luciferase family)
MKCGFVLPGGTATEQLELAILAEQAGWDGIFVFEAAYAVDPWTLLAAIAQRTSRIRLGTMLTPLPWRRPWKLASQVATLDQLSAGRAILAVGLGAVDPQLGSTGEQTDRRTRAEMLDEGIDLIRGVWQSHLRFTGRHYDIDLEVRQDFARAVKPKQERIPIWVAAAWPRARSMRRALRCDGLLPAAMDDTGFRELVPDDIRAIRAWLAEHGGIPPNFDIVSEGETPTADAAAAAERIRPWAEAGSTWWLETRWQAAMGADYGLQPVHERLAVGPPNGNSVACM